MTYPTQVSAHVTRMEPSAHEHFLAEALTMRILAVGAAFECDIDGALEAGQYGLVCIATRGALRLAVYAHLARHGLVRSLPDLRDPGGRVFELLRAREGDTPLWREAWSLECANPVQPDEVVAYVERYRRFFRQTLQLDVPAMSGALQSDAAYANYLRYTDDLSQVLHYLGITGVMLPDVAARRNRRATINQRLANAPAADGEAAVGATASGAALAADDRAVDIRMALPGATAGALERIVTEQLAAIRSQVAHTTGRDERRELLMREQACTKVLQCLQA